MSRKPNGHYVECKRGGDIDVELCQVCALVHEVEVRMLDAAELMAREEYTRGLEDAARLCDREHQRGTEEERERILALLGDCPFGCCDLIAVKALEAEVQEAESSA